jgi:hypothetical protein
VQHPKYHRLSENYVGALWQKAKSAFYILVIAEIYLLRQVKVLFHGDRKICDAFNHFLAPLLIYGELRHPNRIYELFGILYDIVKD